MPDTPVDPVTPDPDVDPSNASLSVQAFGQSVFVSGGFSPPLSDIVSLIIGTEGSSGFTQVAPAALNNSQGNFTANLTEPLPPSELYLQSTDSEGDTSVYPTGVTILTGITDQPYATEIEYTTPGTTQLLRADFIRANGAKLYTAIPTALPDGGTSLTYSGGRFFRGKDYFGFVDTYDSSGAIGQHTEYGRSGVNTTDVLAPGQVVQAIGQDTFNEYAGLTKFIIGEGVGAETFNGFRVGGLDHDTVSLPQADAARFGRILANATTDDAGTTLHLGHGDSLTFNGVSAAALRRNAGDFTFQG